MYQNVSDKLDIILITFNRAKKLDKTLAQLLAENSPVKNFYIHIIDNNSTDDTAFVVQKYQAQNPNLTYEKNKYNIGGNANIVKAFYKAEKEYVWVLADNDNYCWDSWDEVEKEIEKGTDAIFLSTYECPEYDAAQFFIQTTFLPGMIYKTSNINDTVMGNMEFNISNMFPHLALSSVIINENKPFYIVKNAVVIMGDNNDDNGKYTYTRGYDSCIHPLQKGMNWITGYANSLYLIKDKKVRNYIITHNRFYTELNSAKLFFLRQKEGRTYNLMCVFAILSFAQKLKFLLDFMLYCSLYRIIFLYKNESVDAENGLLIKKYSVRIFSFIRIKLFQIRKKIKGAV